MAAIRGVRYALRDEGGLEVLDQNLTLCHRLRSCTHIDGALPPVMN